MASQVEICNLALQKLGASLIIDLSEGSQAADACNASYNHVRDSELRAHPWNFAIKRAVLAADVATPAFDYSYQFTLPVDCLRVLPPVDYDVDWRIEGRKIVTNWTAPLYIRYIAQITDPNEYDRGFIEVLACAIALHLCETLTQSNQKLQNIGQMYQKAIRDAKRQNAFENISEDMPEDSWIVARE
jgi:hypothetical protein